MRSRRQQIAAPVPVRSASVLVASGGRAAPAASDQALLEPWYGHWMFAQREMTDVAGAGRLSLGGRAKGPVGLINDLTRLQFLDDRQHVAEPRIDAASGPLEQQRFGSGKPAAGLCQPLQCVLAILLRALA